MHWKSRALAVLLLLSGGMIHPVHAESPTLGIGHSPSAMSHPPSDMNLGAWLVSLFADHISAVDSDRCPSHPTCSKFSKEAFQRHGFFIGWFMTMDRLMHEGDDEAAVSPLVKVHGEVRILDPVENNDFWWFHHPQAGRP